MRTWLQGQAEMSRLDWRGCSGRQGGGEGGDHSYIKQMQVTQSFSSKKLLSLIVTKDPLCLARRRWFLMGTPVLGLEILPPSPRTDSPNHPRILPAAAKGGPGWAKAGSGTEKGGLAPGTEVMPPKAPGAGGGGSQLQPQSGLRRPRCGNESRSQRLPLARGKLQIYNFLELN